MKPCVKVRNITCIVEAINILEHGFHSSIDNNYKLLPACVDFNMRGLLPALFFLELKGYLENSSISSRNL